MRLAARGLRDMDSGPETITETAVAEAARRQAQRVQWSALLTAAALAAVYLFVS